MSKNVNGFQTLPGADFNPGRRNDIELILSLSSVTPVTLYTQSNYIRWSINTSTLLTMQSYKYVNDKPEFKCTYHVDIYDSQN